MQTHLASSLNAQCWQLFWCLVHPCTFPSFTVTACLLSFYSWLSLSVCSYLGEALRALLVLEMRGLTVHNQQATERVPAHLPQGCTAVRCNVRSASGGHATVVLGGPPDGELKRLEAAFAMHDIQHPCRGMPFGGLRPRHTVGTGLLLFPSGSRQTMGGLWRGHLVRRLHTLAAPAIAPVCAPWRFPT